MQFRDFTNEQSRQFIDVSQVFEGWRADNILFKHKFKAVMRWVKRSDDREYLLSTVGKNDKSLGRRSPETEDMKERYDEARANIKASIKGQWARLGEMARVNKALRLNRVPRTAAAILRELDEVGLLGKHLHVVGTNSLFAYEARSAVIIDSGLVSTGDADFLWDVRRSLRLASDSVAAEGVLGVIRRADKTFRSLGPRSFRARNDNGYMVDLICPISDPRRQVRQKIGDADDDLYGVEILGLEWLINAPKIEETVIGEDGLPLMMSCIDPRVFAMHKLWVSKQPERRKPQQLRDANQAAVVKELCETYLNLNFDAPELTAVPKALRKAFK